jgi:hypothetical protein
MLLPFLVFKGVPHGCIANCEFVMYPDHGHYVCQNKEWMDEAVMNKWIDIVHIP